VDSVMSGGEKLERVMGINIDIKVGRAVLG
jgi:hypothetical protein